MQDLISITERQLNDETMPTVNARELHAFLESKQEFRHWIKNRTDQHKFVESEDYATSEKIIRGNKTLDYHISLDMAKELSMVERTPKGKQARQYFIEMERRAKATSQPKEISRKDILRLVMEIEEENEMLKVELQELEEENEWYEERRDKLERKLVEVMPKVAFADAVSVKPGSISVRQAAKILGTGQNRLFEFLREIAWVDRHNEPYQGKIEAGYLDSKISDWKHPEKGLMRSIITLVKPKGLHKLQELLEERKAVHQKIMEYSNELLKI